MKKRKLIHNRPTNKDLVILPFKFFISYNGPLLPMHSKHTLLLYIYNTKKVSAGN
jgi:hypothetical protein